MPIPPDPAQTPSSARKIGLIILLPIAFLCAAFLLWRRFGDGLIGTEDKEPGAIPKREQMIREEVVLPQTVEVTPIQGQFFAREGVAVPLVPPKDVEIVLSQPARTMKAAYVLAEPAAHAWAPDAKLHFIRSLATVTPKGACSAWQIVFASVQRQKGYEILIEGDRVHSVKEIVSTAAGAELPLTWYDSDEAIRSIANLPQFSTSTLSGLTFFYSPDAQEWRYGIATTFGNTSMRVK